MNKYAGYYGVENNWGNILSVAIKMIKNNKYANTCLLFMDLAKAHLNP